MSLNTWEKEFYPVRADVCSQEQALNHSILKWTGLLPENLEKHGVILQANRLYDLYEPANYLGIDGNSCALCLWHYDEGMCRSTRACPILQVTRADCSLEYATFVRGGQVSPMLNLLQQVKEALNAPQA